MTTIDASDLKGFHLAPVPVYDYEEAGGRVVRRRLAYVDWRATFTPTREQLARWPVGMLFKLTGADLPTEAAELLWGMVGMSLALPGRYQIEGGFLDPGQGGEE